MLNKYLVIVTGITFTLLLHAQVDSFTLASGTVASGKVTLALSLNSPAGSDPAAVQWTLTYSSSNVASVTAVAGASLTSAAKTISCSASAGSYTCVASGMNTNAIANGVVASITFTMTAAASNTPVTLAAAAVNPSGGALNVSTTGGTISGSGTGSGSGGTSSGGSGSSGSGTSSTSGVMSVSSVACNPVTLIGGSPSTCTATLTEAAPAAGQVVSLFAVTTVDIIPASAPASITIPASKQSGTFVVTTSAVTSDITVLVVAEIGPVGKYTSIVLTPRGSSPSARPAGPASTGSAGSSPPQLSCFPRTVAAPGKVTCELQLATRSAEARDLALRSSAPSLHVPDTVTVRPNQSSLSFQAIVDETAPSGTLSIESSVGDRSAGDRSSEERITVIAQVAPRKTEDAATGGASGAPQIRLAGNAASGSAESICAAGSLASIEGTGLARGEVSDPSGAVSGRYVPLVSASGAKVVFVCPASSVAPMSVSLEADDVASVTAPVASRNSAPEIFTIDGSGQGQAAATIFDGSRLAMARNYRYSSEPAQPGDTMSIAVTGLSPGADPGRLLVAIGDLSVPVDDVHVVTGRAGVEQIAVTIPSSAPTGDAVPIVVKELLPDGSFASSAKATIAIEPVRQ